MNFILALAMLIVTGIVLYWAYARLKAKLDEYKEDE